MRQAAAASPLQATASHTGIILVLATFTLRPCAANLISYDDLIYDTPPTRPTWMTEEEAKVCTDKSISEDPFEPLCPPGFYRCCATCQGVGCWGSKKLMLSWRGVPECLLCEAGDFCDGCDMFKTCPPNDVAGREGPRISQRGTSQIVDCESCPQNHEASFSRDSCAPKYSDVCNLKQVERCIRGCRADIPARGKTLTECEFMKCSMYCTTAWSKACGERYSEHCVFLKTQPFATGLGIVSSEPRLAGCDVDCSGARSDRWSGSLGVAFSLAALLAWARF